MATPCPGGEIFRFGAFEFASATGELRRNGLRLKLQDQPVRILILLLENAGEVVTREQIQKRLWADGVHVDYENAINSAVRKLREVLIDTSENPRFVETLPRRGYRFLAPVTRIDSAAPVAESAPIQTPVAPVIARSRAPLIAATAIVATGMAAFWFHGRTQPELPLKAVPFASYPGYESSPSLSPDGNQVAFIGGFYSTVRIWAGVSWSALSTVRSPVPCGAHRFRNNSDGAPLKMAINGIPAAAAACCPAES
jgi:DNA-binding winged helix-turn-helix (wHTH) protein